MSDTISPYVIKAVVWSWGLLLQSQHGARKCLAEGNGEASYQMLVLLLLTPKGTDGASHSG